MKQISERKAVILGTELNLKYSNKVFFLNCFLNFKIKIQLSNNQAIMIFIYFDMKTDVQKDINAEFEKPFFFIKIKFFLNL